jgi:hypothetical protein
VVAQAHGRSELEIVTATEFAHGYEMRTAPTRLGVLHYFVRRP